MVNEKTKELLSIPATLPLVLYNSATL